jgi:hypothetical protein
MKKSNKPISIEDVKALGFKELTHFTIGNNLTYELGRRRQLSISCTGTPNEMLFISTMEEHHPSISDTIVLSNYDYDGYLTIDKLRILIEWFKN